MWEMWNAERRSSQPTPSIWTTLQSCRTERAKPCSRRNCSYLPWSAPQTCQSNHALSTEIKTGFQKLETGFLQDQHQHRGLWFNWNELTSLPNLRKLVHWSKLMALYSVCSWTIQNVQKVNEEISYWWMMCSNKRPMIVYFICFLFGGSQLRHHLSDRRAPE